MPFQWSSVHREPDIVLFFNVSLKVFLNLWNIWTKKEVDSFIISMSSSFCESRSRLALSIINGKYVTRGTRRKKRSASVDSKSSSAMNFIGIFPSHTTFSTSRSFAIISLLISVICQLIRKWEKNWSNWMFMFFVYVIFFLEQVLYSLKFP